jgi:hypothetical protein
MINIRISFLTIIILISSIGRLAYAADKELISQYSVQDKIGYQEEPIVKLKITINKTRDLHVSVVDMQTWRPIKRTMKRIKKSGNYHFELSIDDLKPGNYRVDAYLTPRGKTWADRLDNALQQEITVVENPVYIAKTQFSSKDFIKQVTWPKKISSNQEHILTVKYGITEPRDLYIKLLDSTNWQEYGEVKIEITEPGEVSLPFSDMLNNFDHTKYAWVIYLTASGDEEPLIKKFGKHFTIGEK